MPLLQPGLAGAGHVHRRTATAHFAGLAGGVRRSTTAPPTRVTVTSPVATTVTVSGAKTAGFTTYGTEVSAPITLAAGSSGHVHPDLRS